MTLPQVGVAWSCFQPGSRGNASPIATIAGPHTGLQGVQSIAVDSTDSIYVGAIEPGPTGVRIFAAGNIGDVKPRTTIGGHNTAIGDLGIENPTGVALDPKGQLLVANASGLASGSGALFFPPGSAGDVRPNAAINGAVTGIDWPARCPESTWQYLRCECWSAGFSRRHQTLLSRQHRQCLANRHDKRFQHRPRWTYRARYRSGFQ